ncbi:RidA family protein [Thauera sp. SDU_THAU2]|uniref:RidA family protein n=1 Tax=Thauera sp. SDU_THAU2 TaxID=3136633 RepID=UPI00311ED9D9
MASSKSDNEVMQVIATNQAPGAIGPYSQAMAMDRLVFTSGQIPLRADGTVVEGDIKDQTRQVIANLQAVLEAAGAGLETVLKTTVFVQDMDEFAQLNEVYASCFGKHKPARSTVEVARLPRDVRVEIEAIALRKNT